MAQLQEVEHARARNTRRPAPTGDGRRRRNGTQWCSSCVAVDPESSYMVGRPESRDVERWGLVIGDRKRGDGGHRRFKGHENLTPIRRTPKPPHPPHPTAAPPG